MFQTDQPTASPTLPTPAAAGTPGFFTNGNPASGVAATIVDADILNMMMMELVNVVVAAGESPSKTTYTQVRDAIKRLSLSQQVIVDTGTANAYAAANASPLTALPATGFIQCVSIAHANTGASTYAPDSLAARPIYGLGLQPLQGGELPVGIAVLMYLVQSGVNSGNGAWIILESLGGASQIAPAIATNQAVTLGQANAAYAPVAGNASQAFAVAPASAASQALNLGQFSSSVGGSGFQKFPGGLIFQWVGSFPTSATGFTNCTLPIVFPNGCLGAWGSVNQTSQSNISIGISNLNPGTIGVASINSANAFAAASIEVFAIGH